VPKNTKNTKDDYWEHIPLTNQVTRVHVKPRNKLYNPIDSDCPVNLQGLARQRYTIMKTKTGDVEFDLTWDWTTPGADVVNDFEWTGKTVFRIHGPNEVDYGVESREIRSALTDFKYIGSEKRGDESVYVAGPGSLEVIFLEDNQATIRILQSGRSPSFRHTDKTQRLNLSWLSEQFKRKHFRLVYVGSSLQAEDILTKPFTNSEKWESALRLMGISSQPLPRKEQQKMKACAGEPVLQQRRDLSTAQGNLLALQWHLIAGYSLNFVADLIQRLVIDQESIRKIVTSSDVRKREMLHLDRIEWTLEMKLFVQLRVQPFNLVVS